MAAGRSGVLDKVPRTFVGKFKKSELREHFAKSLSRGVG
jgi:hypothetical protein